MRMYRFSAATLLLLALASGCIFSPDKKEEERKTIEIPPNDTPENAILRFVGLYQQRNAAEYEKMLTGDFTFEFSNAADPDLVTQYSTGWFKDDEVISARNLFEGGTDQTGVYREGALAIEVTLTPTTPADDNGAGRDPNLYKTLIASVDVLIDLPGEDDFVIGQAPPQTNRFFLVRGDEAQGLTADQPGDSLHWYIWNWRDESPPVGKPSTDLSTAQEGGDAARNWTWGAARALYR